MASRAEHERAFAFLRQGDIAGTREAPSPLGVAVLDDELYLRYDSNYLLVERAPSSLAELEAELARLGLVAALFPEASAGERLAAEAAGRGWRSHRGVVMVHRGPPRSAGRARVREVGHEELEPLRRRHILEAPWGSEEVAAHLLAAKPRIAQRQSARFFAAVEEGEVVGYADLYLAEGTAQIEDVGVAVEHRRKGLATELLLAALAEARDAGAELVFLVADAGDWPRAWYGRLGFEVTGDYLKLLRPVHPDGE